MGLAPKKRKAAKIVGNNEDDAEVEAEKPTDKTSKKPKKKAKVLTLSFGDDDP